MAVAAELLTVVVLTVALVARVVEVVVQEATVADLHQIKDAPAAVEVELQLALVEVAVRGQLEVLQEVAEVRVATEFKFLHLQLQLELVLAVTTQAAVEVAVTQHLQQLVELEAEGKAELPVEQTLLQV